MGMSVKDTTGGALYAGIKKITNVIINKMPLQYKTCARGREWVLNEKTNSWCLTTSKMGRDIIDNVVHMKNEKYFDLPEPKENNPYVEIKDSPVQGKGLFAKMFIAKGTKIVDFYGVRMTYKDFKEKYGRDYRYCFCMKRQKILYVAKEEPYKSKNLVVYVNEGKNKNVELNKLALYACEDINKGEELFLHYPKDYPRDYECPY